MLLIFNTYFSGKNCVPPPLSWLSFYAYASLCHILQQLIGQWGNAGRLTTSDPTSTADVCRRRQRRCGIDNDQHQYQQPGDGRRQHHAGRRRHRTAVALHPAGGEEAECQRRTTVEPAVTGELACDDGGSGTWPASCAVGICIVDVSASERLAATAAAAAAVAVAATS